MNLSVKKEAAPEHRGRLFYIYVYMNNFYKACLLGITPVKIGQNTGP